MAAALRAAEGGVYFFKFLRGGIFKIFPARGGIPPYPPLFPSPAYKQDNFQYVWKLIQFFEILEPASSNRMIPISSRLAHRS